MNREHESASGTSLLPEGACEPLLIVCERSGEWAVALGRELEASGVRLRETRSLTDCWAELARSPASFAVIELTHANADDLLRRMAWLARDFPLVRLAVVADRSLRTCEDVIREAGATHFLCSPREVIWLVEMVVRHLDRAPRRELDIVEKIWAGLPWRKSQPG